jgi:hypothetical protein
LLEVRREINEQVECLDMVDRLKRQAAEARDKSRMQREAAAAAAAAAGASAGGEGKRRKRQGAGREDGGSDDDDDDSESDGEEIPEDVLFDWRVKRF